MPAHNIPLDPKLDLVLERVVDVPRALVWAAWTQPELIKQWFTPAPWTTVDCTIDLRPGGVFHTVMRSPEGRDFPNAGCILEVVPRERLTWTNALGPGFRPGGGASCPGTDLLMTAYILLEDHGQGTRYTAIALHPSEASRQQHADLGFHQGWGAALDQLVALMRRK